MLDGTLYAGLFASAEMRAIWSEQSTIASWLSVEQAIAACEADRGLIPKDAAGRLAAISVGDLDLDRLAADMSIAGRPIIGLVRQLRERVGPEAAPHIHHGSTTQDVMDTALVLQMRSGIDLVGGAIDRIVASLDGLDKAHGDAPMIGRTNGQHAEPLTFGLKLAGWREELTRRQAALTDAAARGLTVQFGGPVGNLANFDPAEGIALRDALAGHLALGSGDTHWQNARDGIGEIVAALGLLCATLCRIAHNVNALSGSDIAELHEPHGHGKGASSSMAHKRNQRASEFAEAVARLGRQRAEQIGEIMLHEHERSGGVWIAEWIIVPEVFRYCSGALMWVERMLSGLVVDRERMWANLSEHQARVEAGRIER